MIRSLRQSGLSYDEIRKEINIDVPKGSLSYICKDVPMSSEYRLKFLISSKERLGLARILALKKNKDNLNKRINGAKTRAKLNILGINRDQYIALAVLYWGEGGKWPARSGLYMGSSDPKMLSVYMNLLGTCYGIHKSQMKARIQLRYDQEPDQARQYWMQQLGINNEDFYKEYKDLRTKGNPTTKDNYYGVCSLTCAGSDIQLELQAIADIIFESWGISSAG